MSAGMSAGMSKGTSKGMSKGMGSAGAGIGTDAGQTAGAANGQAIELRLRLPRADFDVDVDLCLPGHGITVLFGASGSGKTSVLRAVAGLERPQAARVAVCGDVWQDDAAGVWRPTHRRPLGFVFQEASLFDHLDVKGNLRFGLSRRGASSSGVDLESVIELLGIGPLLNRRVGQLSGGERQRVGIARAVAASPRLLLLDEPLASIDATRRQEILPWLERLRDELGLPMLYVTHATDELVRLADEVVILERGQVQAQGSVAAVMAAQQGALVAGEEPGALLEGVVVERSAPWHLCRVVCSSSVCAWPAHEPERTAAGLWLRDGGLEIGRRVRLRVLARDVSLALEAPQATSVQNVLPAVVDSIEPADHPSAVLVRLRCELGAGAAVLVSRITARASAHLALEPGRAVWALVKAVAVVA